MRSYMNRKFSFILALLTLSFSFVACDDDDDEGKGTDITLSTTEIMLAQGESQTVSIQSGNGEYSVYSTNGDAAIAIIKGTEVTIMGISSDSLSEATITITDKANRKATVDVTVANLFLDASTKNLYVGVEDEDIAVVKIMTGNPGFTVTPLENSDQLVSLDLSQLESTKQFSVKGISEGTAKVKVTDATGREVILEFNIVAPKEIVTDAEEVVFEPTELSKTLQILDGNEQYYYILSDSSAVEVTIEKEQDGTKAKVIINAKKNANLEMIIRDSKKQKKVIPIEIKGRPEGGLNFSDQYFAYTKFGDFANTDPSIKECKQVTYEIVCKLNEYNWLKTFMGLEGFMILRANGDGNKFEINHEENPKLFSSESFPLNIWIHVSLVIDLTQNEIADRYKLYINGERQEVTIEGDNRRDKVDLTRSNDGDRFVVGQASGDDRRLLRGIVAEARVWKTARTEAQLRENIYSFKSTSSTEGLLALWNFTEEYGNEINMIQDKSGHNIDLTLTKRGNSYETVTVPQDAWTKK